MRVFAEVDSNNRGNNQRTADACPVAHALAHDSQMGAKSTHPYRDKALGRARFPWTTNTQIETAP